MCAFRLFLVALSFSLFGFLFTASESAAQVDSTYFEGDARVYRLHPISVTAARLHLGSSRTAVDKEALHRVLSRSGVGLVRRGVTLGSDVYLDGFKRGDVGLVIDGERYPSSCPSRMDPPAARLNPLEIEAVRLDRTSGVLQAGLGGRLFFERARPSAETHVRAGVTRTGLSDLSTDAALSFETRGQRITGRVLDAEPYRDAAGQSFQDRYGFSEGPLRYRLYEASFFGRLPRWEYGATLNVTEDVPFPYLRMDERENLLWSAFASFAGHKLYANRTHHVMDNGLRSSARQMVMKTDATNLTVGLTGPGYEVYYRGWDAWNTMEPAMPGSMMPSMRQHLMPELHDVSAAVSAERGVGAWTLAGRLGLTRIGIGDESATQRYGVLYDAPPTARWFVPFAASASRRWLLGTDALAGLHAEVASEAPDATALFIALKRPMGQPEWVGNPTLRAPAKAALRGTLEHAAVQADAFAAVVHRYVNLTQRTTAAGRAVTYEEADALLVGATLRHQGRYTEADVAYALGQNLGGGRALSEIAPLRAGLTLRTPAYGALDAYVRAEAVARQGRVDEALGETRTPAWYRVDAGLRLQWAHLRLGLDVENATDRLYYRHLSYLRDPFAAGLPVYEPGRLLRLSAHVQW